MTNKTLWHQEIQRTRLAYGISQNKLAVAAGISRPYLSEIETGKIQPSLHIKQKIQEALGRDMEIEGNFLVTSHGVFEYQS